MPPEKLPGEIVAGAGLHEAIGTGVSRIGLAITISGVTTILGFSSLFVSDFSIISMFRSATAIAIFFSLAGAILVMPAVVALMYRRRETNMTAVSTGVHAVEMPESAARKKHSEKRVVPGGGKIPVPVIFLRFLSNSWE